MTFTPGIPADGQSLGNSKPQVRGNFTSIFNAFAVNHVALNSLPEGFHSRVDLVEVATPNPPVGSNSLFSQVSAIPLGELYYVRGSAGPTWTPIQMTNGDPVNASSGVSFLPGGLLIQWGIVTLTGGVANDIPFSPTFRLGGVNNDPWSIQVTLVSPTSNQNKTIAVSAYAFDKFSIRSFNSVGLDAFWMAIGPRT